MKVAFYIPVLNVGGAEKVIINLLNQLSLNSNLELFLITDSSNSLWLSEISSDVKVLNLDSKNNIFIRLSNIIKLTKYNKIDIILSHLTHSNIHALILKFFISVKLVIVEHSITSSYIELLGWKKFFIKLCIKYLYNFADTIVCVSNYCKSDLIKEFNVKANKIKVIYNPVDFKAIENLQNEPLPLNVVNFLKDRKLLISIGRLEGLKNHHYLISSLSSYLIQNNIVLIIVGDGQEKNNLLLLINNLELNNHVYLVGYDLNPYKYLFQCQILIHPSRFEGFGLVLIEAIYLQKNVVSFDFDVAFEVLDNGNLGSIVSDRTSLISALDIHLNYTENTNDKAIKSKKVFDEYNIENITNQYKVVISTL